MGVISIFQMREAPSWRGWVTCPWSHSKKQKMGLSHSGVYSPFHFLSEKHKAEGKEGKNNPPKYVGVKQELKQ